MVGLYVRQKIINKKEPIKLKRISFFLLFTIIISLIIPNVNFAAMYEDGAGIYSRCAYMVNLETGRVVVDKNSDAIVYPASLTKIMTCILALEMCEDPESETVTVPSGIFADVYSEGGANISLYSGEEISVIDLIYATMLHSACDAASALAWHFGGESIEAFVEMMNEKAASLGAVDTNFVNAHGLHHDRHVTTAYDIYLIAKYAMENEDFAKIVSTPKYTIPKTNKSRERNIAYTITMLDPESSDFYPNMQGIKSGFTSQAGRCLASKAQKDGMSYILILLGANLDQPPVSNSSANMANLDAVNLYEYCFKQYSLENVLSRDETVGETEVLHGTESLSLAPLHDSVALIAKNEKPEYTITVTKALEAPVMASHEPVGRVLVTLNGEQIADSEVFAATSVERSPDAPALEGEDGSDLLLGLLKYLGIAAGIVAVLFILFVIGVRMGAKKNRKRR